jgi:glycosidase
VRAVAGAGALALALVSLVACGSDGGAGGAPDAPPRVDFRGGTVYEIFVRSYADSDGDGVGDLKGLTAHLDYLNDGKPAGTTTSLGVDAVWLMPIFPSPSDHGYDVTDYRAVNPSYGTLADFDAFVAAAHQRGVRVILDFVLNHASSQHPWFVDSATGPGSPHRDDFMWRAAEPTPHWHRPWDPSDPWYAKNGAFYYGLFCGCMPDWNLGNPAIEAELTDAMKFWIDHGVDGFRLDAVRYFFESPDGVLEDLPETHAFLRRLRASLTTYAPRTLMVGEAWAPLITQASYWGQGDELQLAFSFDLADALKSAAAAGDASAVVNLLASAETVFAGKDRGFEAPFLSNHDQVRVLRALDDAGAMRVAAASLFAMPGTPFVYYGEELGMRGGPGGADENKRTPFRWDASAPNHGFTTANPWYRVDEADGVDVATERADAGSLWHLYQRLIGLRRAEPALQSGDTVRPAHSAGAGVLALVRGPVVGRRVLVIANFGASASGAFTVDVAGTPALLFAEGLTGAPAAAGGKVSIQDLAAHGFVFVAMT